MSWWLRTIEQPTTLVLVILLAHFVAKRPASCRPILVDCSPPAIDPIQSCTHFDELPVEQLSL